MHNKEMPIRKNSGPGSIIVSALGVFFFALAAYMIYKQLSKYTFSEIMEAVYDVSGKDYFFALLAVFLSYTVLALYDFFALKYIGKRSFFFKWIMAGFTGFAISNNAGHAFISGTAIRYHLYKRWGFSIPDIIKMVTFSSFTYLIGCFFLLIIGYLLTPNGTIGNIPHSLTVTLVIISVICLIAYFLACLKVKESLTIYGINLHFPSLKLALSQVIIGSSDVLLASLVLFSLLHSTVDIPFTTFIGVFLIAQVLGTFSQVPGGVGVFESIFFFVMADSADKEIPLIAGLIVYRILYYLLPLIISAVIVSIYEIRFRYKKNELFIKWKERKAKKAAEAEKK